MERNVWILLSGPSGVGKSTMIEQMLGYYHPKLMPVVTATTRAMRIGEREGQPYYFLDRQEFLKRKTKGEFLETTHVHGLLYGTPRAEVEKKLGAGHDLIMHVDWQGKRKLVQQAKKSGRLRDAVVSVFVRPKSIEDLKRRLERRARNTPAEIAVRLENARVEISHAQEYDYTFVSGTYDQDFQLLRAIYLAEKARTGR